MVRTYRRKYTNSRNGKSHLPYLSYSAEDLNKAIEAVKNNSLKLKEAAENYNIPISTLSRKCRNVNCTQEKAGHPTLFSCEEEKLFVQYILLMSQWGFPLDSMDLRVFAQKYLNKIGKNVYGLHDNMPGVDWARNFLNRHRSKISNRLASNISSDRAMTTIQMIDVFFINYEKSIEGVSPDCIINYDETNLTDDPGNKKYIFKRGCKYPERILNSSKSSISLMFSGTADGQSLPIYVVYKADHLWDQWVEGGPEETRYNRSKSGWFDTVCFEDWFNTVIVPYAKKKPGRKVIIGDNLSSHFSQSILQTCNELDITFICLPPKTTHLLQPLDVAFYAPLKKYWREVLTKWKRTEGVKHKTLVKSSFPKLLKKLKNKLEENSKECSNLIAGFEKCGLYPINSERPKSRLPQKDIISEEQIENTTFSVVVDMLQEMRSPTDATKPTNRKRKCNVPPGMSITVKDLVHNQTEKAKPLQKRKNTQKQVSSEKKNRTSLHKNVSNTDFEFSGDEELNLLDTQPIAGPSGLCKAYAYDSDLTYVSSDDQRSHQEEVIERSKKPAIGEYVSIKNKGKGKKSKPKIEEKQMEIGDLKKKNKPIKEEKQIEIRDLKKKLEFGNNLSKVKSKGKKSRPTIEKRKMKISDLKNLDLDPESIRRLIASVKAEKSKNKKIKRNSNDSDTTSVSDVMSVHSDSDIIDVDFDEHSSDVNSSAEDYECKDISDCTHMKQPKAAENIQIFKHELIARSYECSSVEQKTDENSKTNINPKLEYDVIDKTDNNSSNSATIFDNMDLPDPEINVHEFSFSNKEPTNTENIESFDAKDCNASSVKCYVTEGSKEQNTDNILNTGLEHKTYNIEKNNSTLPTVCEDTDLPKPGISTFHESNDSHQEIVYPLQTQKDFGPDIIDNINFKENDQNYNNKSREHVESDEKLNEHAIAHGPSYAVKDHVLVRYCDAKKCKYYVGFIEKIKKNGLKYNYTVNFYKTIKKPKLAFRIDKKTDRDEVDDIWIVKKIVLNENPIKAKEFLLANKSDEFFF